MKTIIFDSKINSESINGLINGLKYSDDEKYEIYFSTSGGELHAAEILVDYINKNNLDVELICTGGIQSSGFMILAFTECKKKILNSCWGMMHKVYVSNNNKVSLCEDKGKLKRFIRQYIFKKKSYEDEILKVIKHDNETQYNKYKSLNISQDKLNMFLRGEDVYFTNDEMKKIFE